MAKMRLKPMNPGELIRRVTFQSLTSVKGTTGFGTEVWVDFVTVAAAKKDLRGEERLQAAQLSSPFDTMWQTWYRKDLDPDVLDVTRVRRIIYQGRIYDITRAMPIEIFNMRQGLEFETLAGGRLDGN